VDGLIVTGGRVLEIAPENRRQEISPLNPDVFKPTERPLPSADVVKHRFPARSVSIVELDCRGLDRLVLVLDLGNLRGRGLRTRRIASETQTHHPGKKIVKESLSPDADEAQHDHKSAYEQFAISSQARQMNALKTASGQQETGAAGITHLSNVESHADWLSVPA